MQKQYQKPEWSSVPKFQWYLEVIKSGTVAEVIDIPLSTEFVIIGRQPESCTDKFVLAHESISRQHAIIQHRNNGWMYIYDLGSTHHTFWNKNELKPFQYIPLRVGDILKFGDSTRLYVVGSNDVNAKILSEDQRKLQNKKLLEGKKKKFHEQEEDSEDESDLDHDSQDEKAFDALDDEELLRRKRSRIEEESYDNSLFDQGDEFFDRTKKKKKKEKVHFETTTSLIAKKKEIEVKIDDLEKRRSQSKSEVTSIQIDEASDDPLEKYMRDIKNDLSAKASTSIDKEIEELIEKKNKLEKLIDLSKPAIVGFKSRDEVEMENKKMQSLDIISSSMFVQRKRNQVVASDPKLVDVREVETSEVEPYNEEEEQEFDQEEGEVAPKPVKMIGLVKPKDLVNMKKFDLLPVIVQSHEGSTKKKKLSEEEREFVRAKEAVSKRHQSFAEQEDEDQPVIVNMDEAVTEDLEAPLIPIPHVESKQPKAKKDKIAESFVQETEWTPPTDQKGDGQTKLNEKYGY